jgi:hypothetical protein
MAFLGLLALLMPDKRGGRLDRRLRERLEHPEPYVERLDD